MQSYQTSVWQEMVLLEIRHMFQLESLEHEAMPLQNMSQQVISAACLF